MSMARSVFHLMALVALSCAVAGPVLAEAPAKAPAAKAQPVKPGAKGSSLPPPDPDPVEPGLKTSDQLKRGSVEGAATTPLRDLGVMKVEIPQVLLDTLEDPYARPPAKAKCAQIIALIRPLNEALGPDIDVVPIDDEGWTRKGKSTALGVAGDLAGGAIPFRGVVRRLSGADSHDRLVAAAIVAGHARRAYLKGLGEARGCGPPATPTHARTAVKQAKAAMAAQAQAPEAEKAAFRPKYPTRQPAATQTPSGSSRAAAQRPRT
jgi:hypothetical protein